jgi:sensor c-di-GMP phosphodiesterase-like protein
MIDSRRQRALVAQAAPMTMAVVGIAAGCLLGYALAVYLAEAKLDEYSTLVALQQDASTEEGLRVLSSMKDSPHPACSDAELAYFRELVFRSIYLKDAGRMHAGRIDCSATADRSVQSIGQLSPELPQPDGSVAYGNLLPIPDAGLKRAGLQMGDAYVVFVPQVPISMGNIPMRLTYTLNPPSVPPASTPSAAVPASTHPQGPYLTREGRLRQGDMLYVTRCSTAFSKCVTATAAVSEAFQGEGGIVVGATMLGGLSGGMLGMLVSFIFSRSLNMEQQLRRAIAHETLDLVYQPIVNMETERIVGAEALARWIDEDGACVGPDVFIKVAEARGFVTEITRLVIRRALKDFAETLRARPDFRLSVNVTAQDLCDPAFLPMLDEAVKRARIQPRSLVIEITESSTANRAEALESIRELRRRGHSIHIDDFGTGYSSLSYLLFLNVDTIKVDQAFTKAIGTESVTVAILPQILAMAEALKMGVVAEGVETQQQANYFSNSGREIHGQGWLFGRPASFDEFLLALKDQPAVEAISKGSPPMPRPRSEGMRIPQQSVA